eukprot:7170449-Pyramimonas_sp.AAC.1
MSAVCPALRCASTAEQVPLEASLQYAPSGTEYVSLGTWPLHAPSCTDQVPLGACRQYASS